MSASEIEPNTSNSDDFNIKDVKEQSKNTEIITNTQFDESLTEEECSFYLKAYPNVEIVRERRVHCTVCRVHLGTAPGQISNIKMHPILRVTHCLNCHEFYNSGEFSRGEDGSELYCRWCGQGGEVYCCSRCPFVFCKSCILKNLQSDIISDIEKNENWNCFYCSPKILWPLRAQHWALMKYIDHQVSKIDALDLPNDEYNVKMNEDNAKCCRLAKSRSSNLSESIESLNSISSKHSDRSNNAKRKKRMSRVSVSPSNNIKRIKVTNNTSNINNDEVVCTPDLLTMLEPDCQLSASPHQMIEPTANVINSTPPPLVLRNSSVQIRSLRDGISYPTSTSPNAPVYHVVNGFRIDLNTAAQKSVYRLPNGKFIQVKRSGVPVVANPNSNSNTWQRPCELRPVMPGQPKTYQRIPIQQQQSTQHFQLQMTPSNDQQQNSIRSPAMQTNINNINLNHINTNNVNTTAGETTIRVPIVRHVFPKTAIGEARSHLQDKVLEAHSICHRFNGKLISFSNSNAYKQVQNYNDIKELYIHMSYMCTYVSECMKTLQDDVLKEMRQLGFVSEANDLKHGQLPAGTKNSMNDDKDDVQIIEQATDTICLDSDDETTNHNQNASKPKIIKIVGKIPKLPALTPIVSKPYSMSISSNPPSNLPTVEYCASNDLPNSSKPQEPVIDSSTNTNIDEDYLLATQTILASMLEVEINENPVKSHLKKSPRPKKRRVYKKSILPDHLNSMLQDRSIVQKRKRNDKKLKMACRVNLTRVEDDYPFVRDLLNKRNNLNYQRNSSDASQRDKNQDNINELKRNNQPSSSNDNGVDIYLEKNVDKDILKYEEFKKGETTQEVQSDKEIVQNNKFDKAKEIVQNKEIDITTESVQNMDIDKDKENINNEEKNIQSNCRIVNTNCPNIMKTDDPKKNDDVDDDDDAGSNKKSFNKSEAEVLNANCDEKSNSKIGEDVGILSSPSNLLEFNEIQYPSTETTENIDPLEILAPPVEQKDNEDSTADVLLSPIIMESSFLSPNLLDDNKKVIDEHTYCSKLP